MSTQHHLRKRQSKSDRSRKPQASDYPLCAETIVYRDGSHHTTALIVIASPLLRRRIIPIAATLSIWYASTPSPSGRKLEGGGDFTFTLTLQGRGNNQPSQFYCYQTMKEGSIVGENWVITGTSGETAARLSCAFSCPGKGMGRPIVSLVSQNGDKTQRIIHL